MNSRAHLPRILALVQAGGAGSRLDVLTRETPKPALPYAGAFRLIDVPLSNLRNSGISDVWVSVQYLGQSLSDVMANGKPWDLDRHRGGFRVVMPEQAGPAAQEGFVSGNAEELLSNRDAIRRHAADAVLVLSADHVYRLDYADVVEQHLRHDAECTVVTTEVDLDDASHHAVVITDDEGRVERVEYKPDQPPSTTVATEVFVYQPEALVEVLEELHRSLSVPAARSAAGQASDEAEDDDPSDGTGPENENEPEDGSALGDFGEHLLPAMVDRGRVHAYRMPGYWRDLGRPETYLAAHRELLAGDVPLFDRDWPLTTTVEKRAPARLHLGCSVVDSMISDGCEISGAVRNSVLGPGVVVEAGGQVRDSVVFADVVVRSGATVDWSIVDHDTEIGGGARVGTANPGEVIEAARIALVGADCRIAPGAQVAQGARLEPGTVAE
ncbi:MAG TPA: sugar phosphate nucleotidyltransferase [Microlunatus sp.]|nr:sugar phosphate nucleotidyltransferase [Microlunatus sp.]